MSRRVLAIATTVPGTDSDGESLRTSAILQGLRRHSCALTVAVVMPRDSEGNERQLVEGYLPGSAVELWPPDLTSTSRLALPVRGLKALTSGVPSWIAGRHSTALARHLELLPPRAYDVIVCIGEAAANYARFVPPYVHIHIDRSNILGSSIPALARQAPLGAGKMRLWINGHVARRYERRLAHMESTITVSSREEADRYRVLVGREANGVIPSIARRSAVLPAYDSQSRRIIWLGRLTYKPNVDGLERFLADGVPILRAHGLVLSVVGSGGNDMIRRRVERHQGAEFLGYVTNLEELVSSARAGVVPLWSGAGMKLKTLTLMGLGLPLAATTIGMEGVNPRCALIVSDDAAELASALVMATPSLLVRTRRRAYDEVRLRFSESEFDRAVRRHLLSTCP